MEKCKYEWGGMWDDPDEILEEQKEGLTALRAIRETTRILIGSWKQVCNLTHEETN